jgi:leader peptidase (prepilin peptidase)/N-methyltransferase
VSLALAASVAVLAAGGGAWMDALLARSAAATALHALELTGHAPEDPRVGVVVVARCRPRARVRAIPRRRALVAVLTGAAAGAVGLHTGVTALMPAQAVLAAALVPLAAVDAEWLLLPRRAVWSTLAATSAAVVLGAGATGDWHRLVAGAITALVAFAAFAAVSVANPRWMGFGDVRLVAPIGLVLGCCGGATEAVAGLLVVNALTAAAGVVLLASRRARAATSLPYGVFLAAGTIATLLLTR